MPELNWNEYDFIECLGVIPETDDYFCSHEFTVEKDNLILEITVYQNESFVAISLTQRDANKPFINLCFIVREKIEFKNKKGFSVLKFIDIVFVESRFWMERQEKRRNYFDKEITIVGNILEVSMYPKFEIKVE